ncbi:ArsR/SmtB family transcription factor [Corynebacterium glyciniphilum]|uniref:ArsR/SmtB family transcription factor n=1 Tax=Corynebacterium glyciniphilum TaxID=1404244 RepID=UPI003FD134BA
MAEHDDLTRRVTELEARVTELEGPRADHDDMPTDNGIDGIDGYETFWALNGLVEKLGAEGGVTYTGHVTPPGSESPVSWQMGLTTPALEEIDFSEAADTLSAVGHPVRLSLLQAVYEGSTTVAELSADDRFGTTGQIYHHIHALAGAGWLEKARRGHWRLPEQKVIPLLTLVLIGTH